MSHSFPTPRNQKESLQSDQLDASLEETEEKGDTFPDGLETNVERADALWKIRRKFSSTILRHYEGSGSSGVNRRASCDTASAAAAPKGRRRGLSLSSLQRFFGADGDPATGPERIDSNSSWRPFRRGNASREWDFKCQGEAPVVPTRSDEEPNHNLLDCWTSWASDIGLDYCSATSSPTSTGTFATSVGSPTEPCLLASPTSNLGRQSGGKVSIDKISAPILSPPPFPINASSPIVSKPIPSSSFVTPCMESSN